MEQMVGIHRDIKNEGGDALFWLAGSLDLKCFAAYEFPLHRFPENIRCGFAPRVIHHSVPQVGHDAGAERAVRRIHPHHIEGFASEVDQAQAFQRILGKQAALVGRLRRTAIIPQGDAQVVFGPLPASLRTS